MEQADCVSKFPGWNCWPCNCFLLAVGEVLCVLLVNSILNCVLIPPTLSPTSTYNNNYYYMKINMHMHAGVHLAVLGSLSNHDNDGNKNPTNLHIWQWKTVFLHALHMHFSSFDILKMFSFFLRGEMTCFAVVWTKWAYVDKCSILSAYVPSPGSNLFPG